MFMDRLLLLNKSNIFFSKPRVKTKFLLDFIPTLGVKKWVLRKNIYQKFSSQHSLFWCMFVFFLCFNSSANLSVILRRHYGDMQWETTFETRCGLKQHELAGTLEKWSGKKTASEGAKYRGWERVQQKRREIVKDFPPQGQPGTYKRQIPVL